MALYVEKPHPKAWTEVRCEEDGKIMIADVKFPNGLVLEIQHSPISPQKIKERQTFHRNVVWLFDATGPMQNSQIGYHKKIEWIQPRETMKFANEPVFIDVGFTADRAKHEVLALTDMRTGFYTKKIYNEKTDDFYRVKAFMGPCKILGIKEFTAKLRALDKKLKKGTKENHSPPKQKKDRGSGQLSFFKH